MQLSWLSSNTNATSPTNENQSYYVEIEITESDLIFLACFEQLGLSVVEIASDLVNLCDRDDSYRVSWIMFYFYRKLNPRPFSLDYTLALVRKEVKTDLIQTIILLFFWDTVLYEAR